MSFKKKKKRLELDMQSLSPSLSVSHTQAPVQLIEEQKNTWDDEKGIYVWLL